MYKLKIFFLLVLSVGLTGGLVNIAAQTNDKVLVSAGGKSIRQSEFDQLVEFYEWAFETQFTAAERAQYQALIVAGFRQDPAEARKGTDALIKVLAKIRNLDENKQAETRRAFTEDFVADLRAATDDESKFMLSIYERGQGGEMDEREAVEPKILPSNGGAGSQKLVGAWFRSDGTGGARDPSGKTRYNSGTDTTFEFFADGRMQITIKKEALSITQCQINETTKLPGTYSVSGNQLTMNLGTGTSVGTDSCKSSGNFKKTLTPSTLKNSFVVKNLESVFRPDAPLVLCLDGAADDKCFERLIK